MNSAVERAIKCIWERYSEPLSLSDVAKSAILSRFHFSRIFKDATGVTPGRFLSAVRIYQAKRLLVTTSMNITDISYSVGYNSLGSFTNHFTDSVGISPGRFRRMARNGGFEPPEPTEPPESLEPLPEPDNVVAGTVSLPAGYAGARVYVGAFDTPIVQRRPASAVLADIRSPAEPATYCLGSVPDGTWFIHAVAVADTDDPEPWARRSLLIGGHSPLIVSEGSCTGRPVIALRPRQLTDLPILLALPNLEPEQDGYAPAEAVPVAAPDLTSAPPRS